MTPFQPYHFRMNEYRHLTDYYYLNVIVIAIFKKNANLDEKKNYGSKTKCGFQTINISNTNIYYKENDAEGIHGTHHSSIVYIALGSGKYTTTT